MLRQLGKKIFILEGKSSYLVKISQSYFQTSIVKAEKFRQTKDYYDDDDDGYNDDMSYGNEYYNKHKGFKNSRMSYPKSSFNRQPKYERRTNFQSSWKNRVQKSSAYETERTPLEKNFYIEHPDVASRTEDEVRNIRESMKISVTGGNVPKPIIKFSELSLPENLMVALNKENYSEPTCIQSQGWPIALSGRDMIGVSQTGSGKTLAYMLPAIVHATNQSHLKDQRECNPQVLVLGPTRELIQQIHQVSNKFVNACGLMGACVYGGASKNHQLHSLRGAQVCIATPGRLLDFLSEDQVSLNNCSYLVVDEADRMLDMGFEPQIRDIINQIRADRQTLMWSATWPYEIRNLAENFLTDFIHVTIGSGELDANPNIEQKIYVISESEKEEKIVSLLKSILEEGESKVLIFAQMKRTVDYLCDCLNESGIPAMSIHGNFSQFKRDQVLNTFRKKKSSILIATDVAARGLDISDVRHVVNFDFPENIENYIHRIGRTARGSASGISHSFFTSKNSSLVKELISVLKKTNQFINPEIYSLQERKGPVNFRKNLNRGKIPRYRY